ncbi:MAG: Lrp/AsnC ligand binding domain-containing protein [Dehalococcoidia bacterium]|nr:Lrp/AsnC ligand binding domain-containing protein [Dehalococcoidia bacterium]MDW8119627.1 Lrp/AsnC ligand binding domain-containing protein [Chloroflexota bacterium]
MELKEVIAQVPGLQKRFVYYLEAQGYIHPTKVRKHRISRRDYTEADLRIIREVWRYYQRGYAVQAAYDIVARRPRTLAYLTFQVPPPRWKETLRLLQTCPEVQEVAAVYGTTLDFIVKTDTPQEGDIHYVVGPLLTRAGISGAPTVWRILQTWQRPPGRGGTMQAYILMQVPGKDVERVLERLKDFPGIVEASTVYGEQDIIAKASVANQQELDHLVMEQIHSIPGVVSTRTFIVITGLAWSRSAGATTSAQTTPPPSA